MPSNPTNSAASVDSNSSDGGGDGDAGAAAETQGPAGKPDGGSSGRRQTRRRWRLLQYLMGWVEATTFKRSGGGGGAGASAEHDEALTAAAVALVAVTCPGPPAAEGSGDVTRGGGGGGGGGGTGVPGPDVPGSRRPFLIDTVNPPCPFTSAEAAFVGVPKEGTFSDGYVSAGDGKDAVAGGIWGGAFDNMGPFLRHGEGARPSGRGCAAGTARAVWGHRGSMGGSDVDLPAYVGFVSSTLRDCGTLALLLRHPRSVCMRFSFAFFVLRPTCGAPSAGVCPP